jgi:hypothetical protein
MSASQMVVILTMYLSALVLFRAVIQCFRMLHTISVIIGDLPVAFLVEISVDCFSVGHSVGISLDI